MVDLIHPRSSSAPPPRVQILMATFNGARFLEEQLASIAAQTVPTIDMLVSDDGSTDGTMGILRDWQGRWSKGAFEIIAGPRTGFADNFRHLILNAPAHVEHVAFSDQDDVWDPDKLEVAIATLRELPADRPALYGSRTRLIDAEGRHIGYSPLFKRPPGFGNALVQSLVGGNTIVFNRAGFALMRESSRRTTFLMHDWWAYLIVSGAGGTVHYDPVPRIGYRQHEGNAVGGAIGWLGRPRRLMELLGGKFARWTDQNLQSIQLCRDMLSDEPLARLRDFKLFRDPPLDGAKLARLRGGGTYRQSIAGSVAAAIAAAFRLV